MDRFSLRILFQFEIISLPYAIVSILAITMTFPGRVCTASAYVQALLVMVCNRDSSSLAYQQVMNGLLALISINFVVVLVLKSRQCFEKRLVACVWLLATCCATPALVLGYFGFDPIQQVCWITLPRSSFRIGIELLSAMALCYVFTLTSTICCLIVIRHLRMNRANRISRSVRNQVQDCGYLHHVILKIMIFPTASIVINGFVVTTILVAETWRVPV